jgi:Cu/Ag efflux protein CusF
MIATGKSPEETAMQTRFAVVAPLLVALAASFVPVAASAQAGHAGHAMPGAGAPAPAPAMTTGVVKKVDKASGRVTIAHDEIKNLGMPPMTMVFRVKDPAWVGRMKDGDRIRFVAEDAGGVLTLVAYEPVK